MTPTRPDPRRIHDMFASLSGRYDRANTVLSGGVHHLWRRRVVRRSGIRRGDKVLDCATGTGDLAIAFERAGARVTGTDFVEEMLTIARRKAPYIAFRPADAMALPFADDSFDIASISFGIRNVGDPQKAIAEMARVARKVVVLEFGTPLPWFAPLYRIYQRLILPRLGGLVTGDRKAYEYLETSSAQFPSGEDFVALMRRSANFDRIAFEPLTFGIAWLYVARRPNSS
ncbi:MAG TPA: class I SAM-dependent methyltransferase [Thermoanaerobaculia bacterium]|nr:class I SAM-dependent methyltransferase [Thermoanaerobaculia bacterium]